MFPRGAELITQYEASWLRAFVFRFCFQVPHLMLCQGTAYRKFFTGRVGLDADRCPVLYNWTATRQLLEIGVSRKPQRSTAPLEILFLGWVEREKGIFDLLESVARLSDLRELPQFELLIAGGGSALSDAKGYVGAAGLGSVVRFLGWIDGDERMERLASAELLVLPSYVEGMPNVLIEAMAAALPVVATSVGAVEDVVSDGTSGIIVPPGDTDRLFEALRQLVLDTDLRRRMGEEGWRIANEKFSTERGVDKLVELASPRRGPQMRSGARG